MGTSRFAFVSLLALALVQVVVFYPRCPEVMASHFDAGGQADGWMSKQAFFALDLGVIALTAVIFLGLSAIRWPNQLVSLPHKDHWLAPERREETWRFFHRRMLVFGCATLAFLLVVMQWVIEANLDGSRTIPSQPMWWLVGGYLLFSAVWTVLLIRHFYRLPEAPGPEGTSPR